MNIDGSGLPYPTIFGNKAAYMPFNVLTFGILLAGSTVTGLWNLFYGPVIWALLTNDEEADAGFIKKLVYYSSIWASGWSF